MEQKFTFSDEANVQAAIAGLGKPLREYSPQSKKAMVISMASDFLSWLIITALFAALAILTHSLLEMSGITRDSLRTLVIMAIHFFIPVLMGIFLLRKYLLMVRRLTICTGGILTLRGSRLEVTTWEQITAIKTGLRPVYDDLPTIIYRIKSNNGPLLTLDSTMGALVEAQYVEANTPSLLAQYESGTPLALGKLRLDFTGIMLQTRLLPWHDIEAVRYDFEAVRDVRYFSRLSIFQRGSGKAWAVLRSRDLPSLELARKVIEQIQAKQDGKNRQARS